MPETSLEAEEHAQEKQQAADRAVEYVQSGMVVGLGAGSTAIFATQRIGQLLHGLFIGLATEVIVAGADGVRHLTPKRRQG